MARTLNTSTKIDGELYKKEPRYAEHVRHSLAVHLAELMIEQNLVEITEMRDPYCRPGQDIVLRGEILVGQPSDRYGLERMEYALSVSDEITNYRPAPLPTLPVEPASPERKPWRDLIFEDEK